MGAAAQRLLQQIEHGRTAVPASKELSPGATRPATSRSAADWPSIDPFRPGSQEIPPAARSSRGRAGSTPAAAGAASEAGRANVPGSWLARCAKGAARPAARGMVEAE